MVTVVTISSIHKVTMIQQMCCRDSQNKPFQQEYNEIEITHPGTFEVKKTLAFLFGKFFSAFKGLLASSMQL